LRGDVEPAPTDHRRATAERNVEAILDAVETLLERGDQASVTAVASEAGVSRVTVYAHFPTREALVTAVMERAVRGARSALDAAAPGEGDPLEALARVIEAAWRELDRHQGIARATAEHLDPGDVSRAHDAALHPVRALVERGREAGAFRTDLSADWLVTTFFALLHACGDEVRAGTMTSADAPAVLTATLRDLFRGRSGGGRR
jgi:TetR/AcrR family transcriptional regulator, mexCD-oprJ operon repressor